MRCPGSPPTALVGQRLAPRQLRPTATATPPREGDRPSSSGRALPPRRVDAAPVPKLRLASDETQLASLSSNRPVGRLSLRRLLPNWPAKPRELGAGELAALEEQRSSKLETPRVAVATEAARTRLRRLLSSDEPTMDHADMQEVVDSGSLARVDWAELQWLARVAMLNIEPAEATEAAFATGTGKVLEVPAAHQRIVLGLDAARGVQVISFRGTRDRKSFAINLDTRLDRLEQSVDGIVDGTTPTASSLPPLHRGYSRAGRLCLEALQPHLMPDIPLVLTGHSMGGALAVVMALNLVDMGFDVRKVVTWGAPKVGKSECLASGAGLDILRVSHADDLVVYLPPTRLTGYCHMGSGLILTSASAPCYAYLSEEESPCAVEALKKVVSVGSDRQAVHRAASHRMARYLESVDEYAAATLNQGAAGAPQRLSEKDLYRLEGAARRQRAMQRRLDARDSRTPRRARWRPRRWVSKKALKQLFSRNPRKLPGTLTEEAAR